MRPCLRLAVWIACVGLSCSALWLSACSGAKPSGGVAQEGAGVKAVPAGRIFRAEVDETDLILDSEPAAKDYLRNKLVGLLVQQMVELGFDGARATRLAADGKLDAFSVRGHEERIHGQGLEAGLIKKLVLWDVKGGLQVNLSDSDVAGLLEQLDGLPLGSMEEVEALERFLVRLPALEPDAGQLAGLRRKVGDRWAVLLAPYLKIQLDIPVQPIHDYLEALGRVAIVLKDFRAAHPDHSGFGPMEKTFILAALKALHTIEVKPERFEEINALLARLTKMTGGAMPGLIPYLKRDLELAWRDHLVKLDDGNAPFSETKKGFLYFLELFPESKFYPDLELRFLTRWYEHLCTLRPSGLDELTDFQREVRLLSERFPNFTRLDGVRALLGTHCVRVLSGVEASDLQAMERIKAALKVCDPVVPAGIETVEMRGRLERMEQRLVDERDDRVEKKALADLTFFIEWDRAVQKLPWAGPRKGWTGKGAFLAKWDEGSDAGSNCHCSLDPDEPCREFESEGPAGGFEVVARFHAERLAGVDLCQVYTGDKLEPVFRFFARRYRKAHSGREAADFLAGPGSAGQIRSVRFKKPGAIQVTLERSTDSCTVRYRSVRMLADKKEDERAARAREARERKKARKERIRRGWRPGECVRWECDPVCQYEGRIKTRRKSRYQVTITGSRENPRQEGSDVWVVEGEIYDCR